MRTVWRTGIPRVLTHCSVFVSFLQLVAGLFSTKRSGLEKTLRLRRRGTEQKVD